MQIFLGREDLKYLNDFGMDIAERATVRSSKGEYMYNLLVTAANV